MGAPITQRPIPGSDVSGLKVAIVRCGQQRHNKNVVRQNPGKHHKTPPEQESRKPLECYSHRPRYPDTPGHEKKITDSHVLHQPISHKFLDFHYPAIVAYKTGNQPRLSYPDSQIYRTNDTTDLRNIEREHFEPAGKATVFHKIPQMTTDRQTEGFATDKRHDRCD